jgi:hypothetical protein
MIPTYYNNSIPNHPNYFLGSVSGSICDSITSVNEIGNDIYETSIKAFPNPAIDKISIQFHPRDMIGSINIYNTMSQLVLTEYIAKWSQYKQIDISNLTPGVYVCNLSWGLEIKRSTKFLKK